MNCIIIDDEFPSREELKYFINNFSSIEISMEFDNGIDALKYINDNESDIIFLDINMPMLDGVELAKILCRLNRQSKVVFITAYKEYALEAFEVHAFDYILKPYSKEKIISSLKRLEESKNETVRFGRITKNNKISVIKNEKIYILNTEEIYFIEADKKKVKVYTKNNEYESKNKISDIEERLCSNEFYKVHRSYIVNLEKVEEIEPWFNGTYILKMKDINKEVPVSRTNVKEFRDMLGLR